MQGGLSPPVAVSIVEAVAAPVMLAGAPPVVVPRVALVAPVVPVGPLVSPVLPAVTLVSPVVPVVAVLAALVPVLPALVPPTVVPVIPTVLVLPADGVGGCPARSPPRTLLHLASRLRDLTVDAEFSAAQFAWLPFADLAPAG